MVNLEPLKKVTQELALEVRALGHDSEMLEFMSLILENVQSAALILDDEDTVVYMNTLAAQTISNLGTEVSVGEKWYKAWGLDAPPLEDYPARKAIETRKVVCEEYTSPFSGTKFKVTSIPLIYDGVSGTITICDVI